MTSKHSKLIIVSFSGASGTGRDALASGVRQSLIEDSQADPTLFAPDFAPCPFEGWFDGEKRRREVANIQPLIDYSDINRLGLRERCQRELSTRMMMDIQQWVADSRNKTPTGHTRVLIVNRWFLDIATHTIQELSGKKDIVKEKILARSISVLNNILISNYQMLFSRIDSMCEESGCKIGSLSFFLENTEEVQKEWGNSNEPVGNKRARDEWSKTALRIRPSILTRDSCENISTPRLSERIARVRQCIGQL